MRGVDFEADGKVWTLRYGINALCALEGLTGRKAMDVLAGLDGDSMQMADFRTVFQAGITEKISGDAAGDIIDAIGIPMAADLLGKAVKLAFPDAVPGEAQAEA